MGTEPKNDELTGLETAVKFLGDQALETRMVVHEMVEEKKKVRRVWKAIAALGVVMSLLLAVVVGMLVQSRQRGIENQKLYKQIVNCQTVGSECFEDLAERTSSQTLQFFLDGVYCFNTFPGDQNAIDACITDRTNVVPREDGK